jgi:hypothetical protein
LDGIVGMTGVEIVVLQLLQRILRGVIKLLPN